MDRVLAPTVSTNEMKSVLRPRRSRWSVMTMSSFDSASACTRSVAVATAVTSGGGSSTTGPPFTASEGRLSVKTAPSSSSIT